MSWNFSLFRIRALLISLSGLLALACGSSGGGGDSNANAAAATSSAGTVAILLTDAPADPSLFSEINAVIDRIELIGGGDDDDTPRRVVYDGESREIDLLSLRTHSLPLALDLAVPAERFCKIRLVLASLELVLAEEGSRVIPDLPGGGRIDLVLGDCVDVREGETVHVQLDVDAGRSIHIVEAPPGSRNYIFRPVIHADVIARTFPDKVVRVEGVLTELDAEDREVLLCDVVRVAATDDTPEYRGCVTVRVADDTAVFDNLGMAGLPIANADLYDESWLGESATVVGRVDRLHPAAPAVHIPPGHRPPPGECRLWLIGTPPGHQPAPILCDVDPADVPRDALLIDSRGRPVMDHRGLIAFDAFVIQLGEALRLTGIVDAPPTADEIPIVLDPDQSVSAAGAIDVRLEPAPLGGNGSRILSTTGEVLGAEDVLEGDAVLVDGVLVLDSPDFLRAALVLVDIDRLLERLSTGEAIDVSEAGFTLVSEENGCRTGATLEVVTDEATRFLRVTITPDGSMSALTDGVLEGEIVSVTGVCHPEGLVADTVLIVDDERP